MYKIEVTYDDDDSCIPFSNIFPTCLTHTRQTEADALHLFRKYERDPGVKLVQLWVLQQQSTM